MLFSAVEWPIAFGQITWPAGWTQIRRPIGAASDQRDHVVKSRRLRAAHIAASSPHGDAPSNLLRRGEALGGSFSRTVALCRGCFLQAFNRRRRASTNTAAEFT